MKTYDPAFQDRLKSAAVAKQKALDKLRARPPVDEAVLAERRAAAERREAAEAEKRALKKAQRDQAEAEKATRAAQAAEAAKAAAPKILTDAEKKASRDARYAARQARKK